MSEVFVVEKGQLTARSRRELREAGVVVAEVADLSRCQFVRASQVMSADDMLWAALDALGTADTYGSKGTLQRERLAWNLLRLTEAAREKRGEYVRPKKPAS